MENLNETKQGFDFKQFIEDSKAVLLNPKEYFSEMSISGGFIEPVIKVLIYGVIIGIIKYIWFLTGLGISSGASWLGGGVGIMALFGSIIFSVIGLFIGGVIMLVISAILSGNTDYEANVRVVAALMVISVAQSLFGFLAGINLYLSAVVNIVISLWGLYITYYALTLSLKAGEKGAKILLIIFAVIVVITSFTGIAARKAIQNLGINNIENMSEKEQQEMVGNMVEKITGGQVKAEDVKKIAEESKAIVEETNEKAENNTKFVKPEEYPEELLNKLSDVLSDDSKLNDEKLNRTFRVFDDIQHYSSDMDNLDEDKKAAIIDSISRVYNFDSFDDVMNNSVKPALFSTTVLSMIAEAKDETGMETMLKALLSQNPVSSDDIRFAYDYWDRMILLEKKASK